MGAAAVLWHHLTFTIPPWVSLEDRCHGEGEARIREGNPGEVLQPGTELALLRPPCSGDGWGCGHPADGEGPLRRDRGDAPRRVLDEAAQWPEAARGEGLPQDLPGRQRCQRAVSFGSGGARRPGRDPEPDHSARAPPASRCRRPPDRRLRRSEQEASAGAPRLLRELRGADSHPAGRGRRAPLPLHQQPGIEPGGDPARGEGKAGAVRPGEGAGQPSPLGALSGQSRLRTPRAGDRGEPGPDVPDPARRRVLLPCHPRDRGNARGRGRALHRGGHPRAGEHRPTGLRRAESAEVRRGHPPPGGSGDAEEAARVAERAARDRRRGRLRHRVDHRGECPAGVRGATAGRI